MAKKSACDCMFGKYVFQVVEVACGYTCGVDVLEICKGEGNIFVAAKQTKQCKVVSWERSMEECQNICKKSSINITFASMIGKSRQVGSNVRCKDKSEARRRRIFKVCGIAVRAGTRVDEETAGEQRGQQFSAGSWRSKKVVDGRGGS